MNGSERKKGRTGKDNMFQIVKPELQVRIDIDPKDIEHYNDSFTLFSTDIKKSYKKMLKVKDDCIEGDEYIDLVYEDLIQGLNYSLQVEEGEKGIKYYIFENMPFGKLFKLRS